MVGCLQPAVRSFIIYNNGQYQVSLTNIILKPYYEAIMEFNLDKSPPDESEIIREREEFADKLRKVHNRDLIVTSIIVLVTSSVVAFAVFWVTGSIKYAAISSAIYPILSVVFHWVGITGNTGFRSAALKMAELNNSLIALKPITGDNADIQELSSRYEKVANYVDKVEMLGRDFVNAELAMFWEWDTSTQAKTARARDYVNRAAKESVEHVEHKETETGSDEVIEGFVLDEEGEKPE